MSVSVRIETYLTQVSFLVPAVVYPLPDLLSHFKSSKELLEDPTMPSTLSLSVSDSGFESEASGMPFVFCSAQLKSKSYCQYEPSQTFSHYLIFLTFK